MNNLWQVIDQTRADSRNKDFEFDMKIWKLRTLAAHSFIKFYIYLQRFCLFQCLLGVCRYYCNSSMPIKKGSIKDFNTFTFTPSTRFLKKKLLVLFNILDLRQKLSIYVNLMEKGMYNAMTFLKAQMHNDITFLFYILQSKVIHPSTASSFILSTKPSPEPSSG